MTPGKVYGPADFLVIGRRYRWHIVVPVVLFALTAGGLSLLLPNKYRSETVVLVVPQRVPETYVRSTVTTRIEDRVLSIREQILSRTRLERIADEFNLYAEERRIRPMEEIIDSMRQNILTRVVREDAFSVSFVADDPLIAQKVTERLAGLFSEEAMRDRTVLAESTNQFLQTQLDEARQRLAEHERTVEDYRRRYAGELPEQVNSNLAAIQNAELQIQTLLQSLGSDRDRQLLLERQIGDLTTMQPAATPVAQSAPNAAATTAQQLEAAETNVRALATRLTAEHPDLVRAKLAVERLQRQLDSERKAAGTAEMTHVTAAEAAHRNRLTEARAQLDAVNRQIADKLAEETRLRSVISTYRARVELAPTRHSGMVALTRDYETLQHQYQGLLEKYEESKVAANLERRQIGEQFRILDPARVPERPFTPNRLLITAAGASLGLVVGLALAGAWEFKDRTLRTLEEVTQVCAVPVLAVLPSVPMPKEQHRARRRRIIILAATVTGCTVIVAAGLFWKLVY